MTTADLTTDGRHATEHVHVAVIGTGFSGLGAAIALEQRGTDYTVLERAQDVGGTWRDNSYPGCRCDVPSHLYSFSFAPNPDWSETYSPQQEIHAYLRRTAEEQGVLPKVRFGAEVSQASWDATAACWRLETASGPLSADVVMLGNGPLAEPAIPDIPGLKTFEGITFHSARWRHDHDLTGQRVAVIGTGASAIQFVPQIQPKVAHLTLFQRTPPWVLPHGNRPIPGWQRAAYGRFPLLQRLVRAGVYWAREAFVSSLLRNGKTLEKLEALAARHMRKAIADPELRAKLTPSYRPGCKRLLISNDYYPALQQPNVTIETDKIIEVRPHGVVTADGVEHEVDAIVFGTGFRVTDNPVVERVRGRHGRSLAEHWAEAGMQAYKGTTVPAFPNLFLLAGPNTGIGHTSLVVMIEAQVRYALEALSTMERTRSAVVEVRRSACQAWNDQLQRRAAGTVWSSGGCASWYLDAHGRNTTLWPHYTWRFLRHTRHFDPSRYHFGARPADPMAQLSAQLSAGLPDMGPGELVSAPAGGAH